MLGGDVTPSKSSKMRLTVKTNQLKKDLNNYMAQVDARLN